FPSPSMPPLKGALPAAEKAAVEFHEAMQRFDYERSERARIALARGSGSQQAMQQLLPYGCRDVSLIGHRAISVNNCARILETVGWQHAEPVLRFVVRDLYHRGGRQDPYYAPNNARAEEQVPKLPPAWSTGNADQG